MYDYITLKKIDADRSDAARRQRNADYLAALDRPSLHERLRQWWTRRMPHSSDALAERAPRLQAPPCPPVTDCPRLESRA